MPVNKMIVAGQIASLGDFSTYLVKNECQYLPDVMTPGERILAMTSGSLKDHFWLVTVTDKRVLLLCKGIIYGCKQIEVPVSQIIEVSNKTGLVQGEIEILTANNKISICCIRNNDLLKVSSTIANLIHRPRQVVIANSGTQNDVISKLERLVVLKQSGVLNEAEFVQQKAQLIGTGKGLLPSASPANWRLVREDKQAAAFIDVDNVLGSSRCMTFSMKTVCHEADSTSNVGDFIVSKAEIGFNKEGQRMFRLLEAQAFNNNGDLCATEGIGEWAVVIEGTFEAEWSDFAVQYVRL